MTGVTKLLLRSGAQMPQLGLGTAAIGGWAGVSGSLVMSHEEACAAINSALECGYRHLDTATLYRNEDVIGEVLHQWLSSGRLKREDLFITTKLPNNGNRKEDVSRFLKKSLEKLQLSYVDLYLIHSPVGTKSDDDDVAYQLQSDGSVILDMNTDLVGVWKAMEDQVDAGRTKAIGLSCFNSQQIEKIIEVARIPPAYLQIEVHAYFLQCPLRAFCRDRNITVCGFMPLGAPHRAVENDKFPLLLSHPVVIKIATRLNKTPAQVLLRHLIQHDIALIPKSSKPQRMKENIQVFDFELSPEDMAAMDALDRGAESRISNLLYFKGTTNHPEYPYALPY